MLPEEEGRKSGPKFSGLNFQGSNDKDDDAIASLNAELDELRKKRVEERFAWIIGLLIAIDFWFFSGMSTWSGPISILILQIILLLLLGRKWGITDIQRLLDLMISAFQRKE